MADLRTASSMALRLPPLWTRFICLLLGYSIAGWLIKAYDASPIILAVVEAITLHLAWTGTAAIVLANVGAIGLVWAATLNVACPDGLLWAGSSITAAQGWAVALVWSWVFAMVLIFQVGFTTQRLQDAGLSRKQTFWFLILIANIGLRLGYLIELNVP